MRQSDSLFTYRLRPRFRAVLPVPIEEFKTQLERKISQNDKLILQVRPGYFSAHLLPEQQRYWSPVLTASYESTDDTQTELRGHYGPRPSVWTLFMFVYGFIAVAGLFIAIIGSSQMSLGQSGSILWVLPVLIMLFLTMYIAAYIGQYEARFQLLYLHEALEELIDHRINTE